MYTSRFFLKCNAQFVLHQKSIVLWQRGKQNASGGQKDCLRPVAWVAGRLYVITNVGQYC